MMGDEPVRALQEAALEKVCRPLLCGLSLAPVERPG